MSGFSNASRKTILMLLGAFALALMLPEPRVTPEKSFAPTTYGVPDTLAGYKVLAVITSENTACVKSGDKWLIVQASEPTEMDFLARSPHEALNQEAAQLGLQAFTQGGVTWVSPNSTTEMIVAEVQKWNQAIAEAGHCIQLGQVVPSTP